MTAGDLPCIFPFTYNHKVYNSCTTDGNQLASYWCAITSDYKESGSTWWHYCTGECPKRNLKTAATKPTPTITAISPIVTNGSGKCYYQHC